MPAGGIYPPVRARNLGLKAGERARALVFPQISSYVGGDIVAGVMASGMHREETLTLFIDIGTNAEIDIENLIRAKGAIYSGCMTLLADVGMDMDAIGRICYKYS